MQVGCLGNIPFYVSDEAVQTVRNVNWSGSVRYTTHNLHLKDPLVEVTGREPDTLDFDMQLSRFLGIDPWVCLKKLLAYERGFTPVQFVLGDHSYGVGLWLIKSHKVKLQNTDGSGNLMSCDLNVKLVEYGRGRSE